VFIRSLFALLCFGFGLLLALPAAGQSTDETARLTEARGKFQQAIELEQAGNWGGALRLFREVGQVRMTPQVRFHIGVCEENLGRLAVALGSYELALRDAESVGGDFGVEVTRKVESLRARIPKIVIERGPGAEAAIIELDGVALGATSIGVELPIDPGPHAIAARASGYLPFEITVNAAEGANESVKVELARQPSPASAPAPVPPQIAGAPEAPHRSRVLPYAIGAAGAASLLASGIFLILQNGKVSDLEDVCGPNKNQCPESSHSTYDSAKTYNTLSRITLGVGLVAVGTAVTLILTEPKPKPAPSARSRLELEASPAGGGAAFSGVF
jgi:hypothetical protein